MRFRMYLTAAILIAVCGCGQPKKGTVTGTVTHKGKKIVWGGVTLIAADNLTYSSQLGPDGTYSIPGVPAGPVKIAVTSPNPEGATRGGGRGGAGMSEAAGGGGVQLPPPGAWLALPEKYGDPVQSGLTGTIDGDTKLDIELP